MHRTYHELYIFQPRKRDIYFKSTGAVDLEIEPRSNKIAAHKFDRNNSKINGKYSLFKGTSAVSDVVMPIMFLHWKFDTYAAAEKSCAKAPTTMEEYANLIVFLRENKNVRKGFLQTNMMVLIYWRQEVGTSAVLSLYSSRGWQAWKQQTIFLPFALPWLNKYLCDLFW